MRKIFNKNPLITSVLLLFILFAFVITMPQKATAGRYDGEDLVLAILADQSTLVSGSTDYIDTDTAGHRQGTVLSSLGVLNPENGSTFVMLSTGIAGAPIVTTNQENPGDERGTWFKTKYGFPVDSAKLEMELTVPPAMHYVTYYIRFFSAEYPEYVGSQYNDKFTATIISPSKGTTKYVVDVNSQNFIDDSNHLDGTGFDIFAQSGNPSDVDIVDTIPRTPGADAGATALYSHGGDFHPVSPNEKIKVIFKIEDVGDNLFDSAVYIDNLYFSGQAVTDMVARKTAEDLNGGVLEWNDTIKYTITISNTGNINQPNDLSSNEFEDSIPDDTTYVADSATATSGTINYDNGNITWNGAIAKHTSVTLTFKVTVDDNLQNGTLISNQGTVNWDSDENGINDATELTDDPSEDDGIDSDGDGETDDDDPTNIFVIVFVPPTSVTEDFSDDKAGRMATQTYRGRKWFETTTAPCCGIFEVVKGYHYNTPNAFKTKIRADTGPTYWYYNLSELERDIKSWEVFFKCENNSDESYLNLTFKNTNGNAIAKLKFQYVHEGEDPMMDWILKFYYWSPTKGWVQFNTENLYSYLYGGWYKIKIERNGLNYINYSLFRNGFGLVDFNIDTVLSAPFSNLKMIEWTNSLNPSICPVFIWDEHKLNLI